MFNHLKTMTPSSSRIAAPIRTSSPSRTDRVPTALEEALNSGNLDAVRGRLASDGERASPELLRAALDLAVRRNDVHLGELILRKNIVPHWEQFRDASDAMRTLLTYARRKTPLYPAGVNHDGRYTELDRALWNHDREHAQRTLRQRWPKSHLRQIWADAITAGQLDVLRALLMLQYVDKDRGFRLLVSREGSLKDKIKDEAVRRVLKEVPHYSPKRRIENFNSTEVACRHLAQYWMAGKAVALKFNYGHFGSKEVIRRHLPVSEVNLDNMKKLAPEAYLVVNRKLGVFIAQKFDAMTKAKQTNQQILIASTEHDMSLELLPKLTKDEQQVYVVKFFDPNVTTTHA